MLKERIFQFLENEKNKKNKLMLYERIFRSLKRLYVYTNITCDKKYI